MIPALRERATPRALLLAAALATTLGVGAWGWVVRAASPRPASPSATPAATPAASSPTASPLRGEVAVPPSMLRLATVHAQPLPLTDPLSARLVYDEDRTARLQPAWAGRIARLNAAVGDHVHTGQPLALIDSPDYGVARADLAKAQADLALKQQAAARARTLLSAEVIARKDAEQAEADLRLAEAEAERARLRLRNLLPRGHAADGEQVPLTSDIDGWVTERNANLGQDLGTPATAPLFVISDLRHLWLTIDLPEHLLPHLTTGATVDVTVDAWPNHHFQARIDRIGLTLDPATRRVPVRAVIDNADLRLKPEMFARVVIPRPDGRTAIAVDNSALVSEGYDTVVVVQTGPQTFERRTVEVVQRGAQVSYVSAGLTDGDQAVVQGALLLASQLAQLSDASPQPAQQP